MSHPVLWPRSFFYPVGNTPAVCLTDNVPPEESTTVLSLGCGDPRNVLYTLYADAPIHRPALDFICCDIEPAIIARNVLLLTLIHDAHPTNRVWHIFYHMKLDETSFALLISHSKTLLDITVDLESWQKSRYSTFLKFGSQYTLSQVHRYLGIYAQTEAYSREKHEQLFSCFSREFETHDQPKFMVDAARIAGFVSPEVAQTLSKHFHHYWKTGIVSRSASDIAAATLINPTFIYSDSFTPSLIGDRCSLHYGTYPLQGFHLASILLTSTPNTITDVKLISCAQSQLEQWCSTFRTAASQRSVTIALFVADALAFCEKMAHLQRKSDIRLHVSPWKTAELVLDGDFDASSMVQAGFDTIDTSNLVDHVGVLNILIAAVPLLAHRPTSVLYTEFAVKKDEGAKASNLTELLCADIATISVLLGVLPVGCVAQFTSSTRVHEALGSSFYRERFAWKCPCPIEDSSPSFGDARALGDILFSIYAQMFATENTERLFSGLQLASDIFHYHRGTFAALLGLIKSRVQCDWTAVMGYIFQRLHDDRTLIMGSNNYQELCCQLYLRGVDCVGTLGPHRSALAPINTRRGLFEGWKEVPPVVSLVLVVPRGKIRILEGRLGLKLGSPMFQCQLQGTTIFSSIRTVLGTASVQGSGSDARVHIAEDTKGWSGTAPLIVSVCVPAFNLVHDGEQFTRVSLGFYPTPMTSGILAEKLGPLLYLYTASVVDASAVHITRNAPNFDCLPPVFIPTLDPLGPSRVSLSIDSSRVSAMSARWEPGIGLKEAKVGHIQTSHYVLQVHVNNVKKTLVFPFPIEGTQIKIRIARKSGWIEFEAPVRSSLVSSDLTFTSMVVQNRCPIVWSIHRVNLDCLPLLQSDSLQRQASTIGMSSFLSFSDREWVLQDNMFVEAKKTIMQLFVQVCDIRAERHSFVLSDPENGGAHTLLYISGIRMDLPSQTYLIDACVLALTADLMRGPLASQIMSFLSRAVEISTNGGGVQAWKHLLVAFSERCRSWTHKPTCKYMVSEKATVSIEMLQNPLCGCGEGIGLGPLSGDNTSWEALVPLMTRVAISPLFAVPYLESVHQRLENRVCAACLKPEILNNSKLVKCGRCKEADYCGKVCQTVHWKEHKKICKAK
ncbi:hypothetical protein K438DRAFT_1585494 [Mycena galopus ATCC 62051]|nr:hypothetical protein K438DRAFT_1585494 [Mycena galopus ATCC 62051]